MKIHKYIALFVILPGLTSCEKYLEYEGDYAPPRLVLNGLAQTDSVFRVDLSASRSFLEAGPLLPMVNGVVRIFDEEGAEVEVLTHQGAGRYKGNFEPIPGKAYTVRAQSGSFPEAWATDRVPVKVPILALDTLRIETEEFGFSNVQYDLGVRFTDPANTENYYLLEVYSNQTYTLQYIWDPLTMTYTIDTIFIDSQNWSRIPLSTVDPVLVSESDLGPGETRYYASRFLFTDALFNGDTRTFTVRCDLLLPDMTLQARLSNISKDLYGYLRTLERFDYTNGDPFSEPVQVLNNVQGGGLGIWGGAAATAAEVSLP